MRKREEGVRGGVGVVVVVVREGGHLNECVIAVYLKG